MNKYSFFATKFMIACIVLTIDQATKYYFIELLSKSGPQLVNDYLSLGLVWNKGISFGAFSKSHISNGIFMILSSIITVVVASMLIKSKNWLESVAYTLIAGGALGNLFDRFERGAVADFIHLHYNQYYFPAFNFADGTISAGACLLLIYYIRENKIEGKENV